MSHTAIRDLLYPLVEEKLRDKKNLSAFNNAVGKYADGNSDILLNMAFHRRLLMNDEFKNSLMSIVGITNKDVKNAIKASSYIDQNWKRSTSEFAITCILVARYGILLNTKEGAELTYRALLILSYQMYSSAHFNTFKEFTPPEDVVEFAMTKLSDRSYLKKSGSIHGMLDMTVDGAYLSKYKEDFEECTDQQVSKLISGLKDRVNSLMSYIGDLIHDASRGGNSLHSQSDSRSEDNYRIADNTSYAIQGIITNTTSAMTSNNVNESLVGAATRLNAGCSQQKLSSMMRIITTQYPVEVREMVQDILVMYMTKTRNARITDIKSDKFLGESLTHYRSNAQDGIVVTIKERLDKWINAMVNNSSTKISKSRASIDTYKRGIYTFFVLSIMDNIG